MEAFNVFAFLRTVFIGISQAYMISLFFFFFHCETLVKCVKAVKSTI